MARTYHITTLGCPKNQVDSDKLEGVLAADGLTPTPDVAVADLLVVNTCAFISEARSESIDTVLELASTMSASARLMVTGCMAERYGPELADALPEANEVIWSGKPPQPVSSVPVAPVPVGSVPVGSVPVGSVPVGSVPVASVPVASVPVGSVPVASVPVGLGRPAGLPELSRLPRMDLLNLPRPPSPRPWAYVKIAEGCDRACGFCAIPSFRGPQRSRTIESVLAEVEQLDVAEAVLVAQDLAAYGRDGGVGKRRIVELVAAVAARVPRTRLLYLYPANLNDALIAAICRSGVPYFDLSLQHVSAPLLRRMRRWGSGQRFLERIEAIRCRQPDAAFRSNFIVGYPGETESDHDQLLRFVEQAQLDWCGVFEYSEEAGTYAAQLEGKVDPGLRRERLLELRELTDAVTQQRRDALIGQRVEVLVDEPGVGRSHREAPEIDGIVIVPDGLEVGTFATLTVTGAFTVDLEAA